MIDAQTIAKARAVPIEDEIARRGIQVRGKVERVGPCPVCGGRDRFGINTRKQSWNCRGCQKGGGIIDLVQHLDAIDFPSAVGLLTGETVTRPQARQPSSPPPQQSANNGDLALRIWREAQDPRGTIVETYLRSRRLSLPNEAAGEAIRFHSACLFGTVRVPAMVALVRDVVTNEPKAIHRTALTADGHKATIDGVSRLSLGPVGSGAVKLTPDENVTLCLGIGEGIETTLSMQLVPEFSASPVWALLSAGQVERFPVLAGIEALWVAVDRDDAGKRAASACAERWRRAGREVFLVEPTELNDLNNVAGEL